MIWDGLQVIKTATLVTTAWAHRGQLLPIQEIVQLDTVELFKDTHFIMSLVHIQEKVNVFFSFEISVK